MSIDPTKQTTQGATDADLLREGLAAQLYKISNPHGPLWHVLREDLRRRWRNKADDHIKAMSAPHQFRWMTA